ncbi:MAG: YIP1 family protein [candidate division Zixibacteria bacterium]|nr:YIP1 family protein [candidate division Zixibacteria bacterium]
METETGKTSIPPPHRLVGVFFSPGRVFRSLYANPSFLLPLVIAVLVSMIAIYFLSPINAKFTVEQARQQNPNISEEQIMQIRETMSGPFILIFSLGGVLIGTPVSLLLLTFVFRTLFQMLIGGQTTFRQAFGVVSYSNLVMLLGFLLSIPLILVQERPDVSLNLGLLVPFLEEQSPLYRLLRNIDVITGWWMIVLSIGFSVLYQVSTTRAAKIFISLWVFWILFKTTVGTLLGPIIPGL